MFSSGNMGGGCIITWAETKYIDLSYSSAGAVFQCVSTKSFKE